MDWPFQLEGIGLVALAGFFGALIGLEREMAGKPAGLRTHILVAAAAALMMVVAEAVLQNFSDDAGSGPIDADPIRILHAIAVGVSFLGAGTIIHQRGGQVEGLTTASSILFTSGIGAGVAARQFILAGGLTLIALVVLLGIGWIERAVCRFRRKKKSDDDSDEKATGDDTRQRDSHRTSVA